MDFAESKPSSSWTAEETDKFKGVIVSLFSDFSDADGHMDSATLVRATSTGTGGL